MEIDDVFALLEENKNQRGIDNWAKLSDTHGLSSYGIGLTVQRKLAKQIGKNRELAHELWATSNYDAKVLGLLIDEPKQITVAQAETQVEQLNGGMLRHVFSSCDATLAKSPVGFEIANLWLTSDDPVRRSCSYGLAYELSKKKSKALTDDYFMKVINNIDANYNNESKRVLLAMGGALLGIGKRNKMLNQAALALAKKIGPIDFNEDGQKCDPFDVVKHLDNDALRKRLG
jgi:3-methyladenine DNA glycosylase AlkD